MALWWLWAAFCPIKSSRIPGEYGVYARSNLIGGEFLNRYSSVRYLPWLRHGCAAVATRKDPRAAEAGGTVNTTLSPWSGILKCYILCVHSRQPCPGIERGFVMVVESLPFAVDEGRLPPGRCPTRTAPVTASASRPALFLTRTDTYASAKTQKQG